MALMKYIVKPEDKLVIGKMNVDEAKEIWREIRDNCCENTKDLLIVEAMEKYFLNRNGFKATSKCDGEDEFNEGIGKRIVKLKCYKKYHQSMIRKYQSVRKSLLKAIGELDSFIVMHMGQVEDCDYELKRYMEKKNEEDIKKD